MCKYKKTYGRWGVDNYNILTDIETGQHCVGKLYKEPSQDLADEYTEMKLPDNVDSFYIDYPTGNIWITKGSTNSWFGTVKIDYFGDKNKEEHALFLSLANEALFGNRNSAIELLKQLGKVFYLETEINDYDFSTTTYGQACYYITMFMHDQKYNFQFLQLGAFNGNPDCQEKLAEYYEEGYYGIKKNLKIAIKWYKKAAEGKSVRAMHRLAYLYKWKEQYGCLTDLRKAFFWTKKSAEHGDILDLAELPVLYELGIGCAKNLNKACYWYKKIINLPEEQRKHVVFAYNKICENMCLSSVDRPSWYNKDIIKSIIGG